MNDEIKMMIQIRLLVRVVGHENEIRKRKLQKI